MQHLEAEIEVANLRVPELLDTARAFLHGVLGPQRREVGAVDDQLADELGELAVVPELGRDEPHRRHRHGGFRAPVAVQLAGVRVEEQHAGEVRPVGRALRRVEVEMPGQQQMPQRVPGQDLVAAAHDDGRDGAHGVDQADRARPGAIGLGGAPAAAGGGTGEVVQMQPLVVVEVQRPGDRVDHRFRGVRGLALFEAGVVRGRYAGELGQLLTPQARHPARTVGRDPDVLGGQLGPAAAQELAEFARAGRLVHIPIVARTPRSCLTLAVLGTASGGGSGAG